MVLLIAILALCCGAESYQAIAEWPQNYQELIKEKLSFLAGHLPHPSTFHRVFTRLDVEALEEALSRWMATVNAPEHGEGIAIDGKTVGRTGYHLVAAFAHVARSVLFQKGTTKGKELVAGEAVLNQISIADQVVTGDALYAQKDLCAFIASRGGGYVFTVKGNQEGLEDAIHTFFVTPPFGSSIERTTTVEKNRGRIEERTVEISGDLTSYLGWPGLTHVWRCTRQITRGGKTTTEIAVGIARLLPGQTAVNHLSQLIRAHWQIENCLHRPRDTLFGEDRSTIRKNRAPQVMAALRNLVVSIFNRGTVRSFPTAFRRFAAHPEELFSFLGLPPVAVQYA